MKMILRHAFYQIPRKNINKASCKTAAAHEFGMRQLRVFCVAVCVAAMKLCVAVCVAVCVAAMNDSPRAKGSGRKRNFFSRTPTET